MTTALLAIGDELLDGRYADGHARRLARALRARGHRLDEVRIVPDRHDAIVGALGALAADGHTAIVVTGGLGATEDDLTRDAVAAWLGAELLADDASLARVRAWIASRGRTLDDAIMRVHATIPAGSQPLDNPVGLATGFVARKGAAAIAVLPGVPRELEAMLEDALEHLLPPAAAGTWLQRRVLCHDVTETGLESRLRELDAPPPGFRYGLVALGGPVELSISGHGDLAALEAHHQAVLAHLGEQIVASPDGAPLPQRVAQLLLSRGETVSTAESCTGGLVASLLTDVAGSSAYFLEGAVTYSNEAKSARLGVPPQLIAEHGAVSRPVVEAMATGMRARAGTTWSLALSGIAGPGGGSAEKPVGTVHTAIAGPDGRLVHRKLELYGLERAEIKQRSALAVLFGLVRELAAQPRR